MGAMTIIAFALSGCNTVRGIRASNMDETEITQASDKALCAPLASGEIVEAEKIRRGLGDCSSAHLQCHSMGLQTGTSDYLQCRQSIIQQDAANQQASQQMYQVMMQQGFSMMQGR